MIKTMSKPVLKTRNKQAGFTLIEVLVSTLVMAVGILGIGAMQLLSFETSRSAYSRSHAVYLAQDIFDRIRANPDAYRTGTTYDDFDACDGDDIPASPSCIVTSGGCSAAQLAQQDLREWASNFSNVFSVTDYRPTLPAGCATLSRVGTTNEFIATVTWEERDWDVSEEASAADRKVSERAVVIRAMMN